MGKYNLRMYRPEEINEIAYNEFVKEVGHIVIEFEHEVSVRSGVVSFNQHSIDTVVNGMVALRKLAKDFVPEIDDSLTYDFTDRIWDAIWDTIGGCEV